MATLKSRALWCAALIGAAALLFGACSQQTPTPKPIPAAAARNMAVPVTIAEAVTRNVPVEISAIGTVQAYSTVTVKSLVDGQIQQVYFKQGQDVKKGQLLFYIDPRPFKAALEQAKANLAKDTAQSKNAAAQAERYTQLAKQGIISKNQYEQYQTTATALDASVQADQAAVDNAKIQLGYCSIYSPITGRTGNLLVYPGNLVKNNDTSLVVINQISPIYVGFSVPEQYLARIKDYQRRGKLPVEASIPKAPGKASTGKLTFINNSVDSGTGTIMLMGTFANEDRSLWPGQFVNVNLNLTTQKNATVVPSQAVQAGQQGSYVYVVESDGTAQVRDVQPGATLSGITVIEKGVKPGEKVVTNGQLRLFPGAKVAIKSASKSSSGAQPESTT